MMCSSYLGIRLNRLIVLKDYVHKLPDSISSAVDQRLNKILSDNSKNIFNECSETLMQLMEWLESEKPKNFEEYIAYVAFTTAMILIKNRSLTLFKPELLQYLFQIKVDDWSNDIIKIAIIAETIWNISSERSNITYIISRFNNYNNFIRIISVVLLWAAFTNILEPLNETKKTFCLYPVPKLFEIMDKINVIENESDKMEKLFQFLFLYSHYQQIVFSPNLSIDESIKSYFTCTLDDLVKIQNFMKEVSRSLEAKVQTNSSNSIEVAWMNQLLEFEILDRLDALLKDRANIETK